MGPPIAMIMGPGGGPTTTPLMPWLRGRVETTGAVSVALSSAARLEPRIRPVVLEAASPGSMPRAPLQNCGPPRRLDNLRLVGEVRFVPDLHPTFAARSGYQFVAGRILSWPRSSRRFPSRENFPAPSHACSPAPPFPRWRNPSALCRDPAIKRAIQQRGWANPHEELRGYRLGLLRLVRLAAEGNHTETVVPWSPGL
jgi:hypothetical protein